MFFWTDWVIYAVRSLGEEGWGTEGRVIEYRYVDGFMLVPSRFEFVSVQMHNGFFPWLLSCKHILQSTVLISSSNHVFYVNVNSGFVCSMCYKSIS